MSEEKEKPQSRPGWPWRWPWRWRYVSPEDREVRDVKWTLKNFLSYFKKYIPYLSIAVVAAIISSLLALIWPSYLSKITNLILEWLNSTIDKEWVYRIWLFLVCIYAWSGIFSILQWFINATLTAKMSRHMRWDIVSKINKLPIKYFDKTTTWDILSRITNDVFLLTNSLSNSLTSLITSSIMFIGSLILMITTNIILTLTTVLTISIWAVIVFLIIRRSQKHFDNQQIYLWKINWHIEEAFSWHTIIKAYNAEDEMRWKFSELNETLQNNTFMAEFLSWLSMPIIMFINHLWYVIVAVVGAILAFNGHISFWVIVAFLVYIRYFSQPVTQLPWLTQRLQIALAAAERVFTFLHEKEMENEANKKKNNSFKSWAIRFEHVRFWYDKDKIIIKDLSVDIQSWSKVAIVWPTWAGKTTIVNLLMRFHEIDSGKITIDGIDTKWMTRDYIHNLFCMVLQDSWVFEWTIKENIVYNQKDISDDEIKSACKAVWLHHFVMTLPKWYDTVLDEKVSLSMWQKQQLTIARAMISKAPMLILDEATSSIDTRTEKYIQESMDFLMKNRTSFVIAHRLSTIKNADLILVLKEGDVIEKWNHEELMKQNWFYTELYNSQFSES